MHLAAERDQQARVRKLGLELAIKTDETIWTEISCKFTRESTATMLADSGLNLKHWYTDPQDLFALALASPA